MARIRTVKPDLFKHEELFDMEAEIGLPMRLIYIGLWTLCDREGRFKWRPRTLKADAFPHDTFDMSRALDALLTRGFLVKYASESESFGAVVQWKRHQFINNKEPQSDLPNPPENQQLYASVTRESRDSHAIETRGVKEGKVMGKEGNGNREDASGTRPIIDHNMIASAVLQSLCLSGQFLQRNLSDVAKSCLLAGESPDAVRDEMIVAWLEYQDPEIEFAQKAENFFGGGTWRRKSSWKRKGEANGAFKGKTESTLDAAASLIEKIESGTAAGKAEYSATGEAGGSRPSRLLG